MLKLKIYCCTYKWQYSFGIDKTVMGKSFPQMDRCQWAAADL